MRRFWTPAEIATLRRRYPHERTEQVARVVGRDVGPVYQKAAQLGLRKTAAYLASVDSGRLTKLSAAGIAHRFKPGHASWNKGTNWTAGGRSAETRFRKGSWPANKDPGFYVLGALRWNADGYLEMRVSFAAGSAGWRGMHVVLWEDANGPLPKGHAVVFRDGDRMNVDLPNLELVSRADLMRRNTIHNLPAPLRSAIQLVGQLKRRIREKQDRRFTRSPVRNAGTPARRGEADGH